MNRYVSSPMGVVTFQLQGHESTVSSTLAALGFVLGPARAVTTTMLDTFDGRLHRAGLRLQVNECEGLDLVLSGEAIVPAHLAVEAVPRGPTDLPRGPLQSRIAALLDLRALLPQLRVSSNRTGGARRDAAGKVVAIAELYEAIHVIGLPDIGFPEATIEIHSVPGYSKQTRRTLQTLRSLGVVECESDTLTLCAAAVGVDLAGFSPAATVPLDAEMSACDGFRLVLAHLATAIRANWQGTVDQVDSEFLHDLRIAVRRTRTVLADAKAVLPAAVIDPVRDEFKWLADLTGMPRDLDVYLLEWSRYTDPLGAEVSQSLEPVRDLLERHRADVHIELARALRSVRATDLLGMWQTWLAEPIDDDLPSRAGRPLGQLVAKRIARAHGILLERGRLVGPETPAEQVHDLRKDAKRLRYLLECFGSVLPASARKRYVNRLKALQDNLGEHQDAEVHVGMLRAVAHELHSADATSDTIVAIGQLTERLEQQRLAARTEFAERFAEYDTRATQRALDAMLEGITE